MKIEKIKTIVIFTLLLIIWFNGCQKEKIKYIPTRGTFKTDTIIKHQKINGETKFIKGKEIIVYKNNEINKELAEENYNLQIAYINALDSLEKEKLYRSAISLNKYTQTFENDNFKANASGIVQGEIKTMQLDYELKKVPIKEVKFKMFLGGGLTFNNLDLNIGIQNAKGNIFEVGYDTNKNLRVGYKQSIFSIKK